MRFRLRAFVYLAAIVVAAVTALAALAGLLMMGERQERAFEDLVAGARELARLRAAVEDGLARPEVYREALAYASGDAELWVVNERGIALPAEEIPEPAGDALQTGEEAFPAQAVAPFSAEEIETYVAPALAGRESVIAGQLDGRLGYRAASAIVPIIRADGTVGAAFFYHRDLVALERGDILTLWRQLAPAGGVVLALGLVGCALAAWRMAKPIEALAPVAEDAPTKDEILRLQRRLQTMSAQIDDLEELRRGFVSNVSHELRSPLTNIIGYLQALQDGAIEPGDALRYTAVALEEAKRMSALIGDLLGLSRLESGRFELRPEPFDAPEMIRRALAAFSVQLEEKHVRAECDFPPERIVALADPALIRQALDNILGNAIKFLSQGGNIVVRARVSRGRIYVSVADDGPGIAGEDLPHVFEWFYKADKAHSSGGTGLGLAIVRSIIDKHEQAVRVSSGAGKGTIVTFTLAVGEGSNGVGAPA